ncbi:hypothetical protein OPV22_023950 [Ensete ventricosum]|uniref:Uncharacterized protein n=1 Tax=Ensete ventricosum TaxID=4639 RepID=A0AAV8QY40_ENSVE|nr:hypothetical protein OPV22_023950 [Ensete ventricosum]
MVASGGPTARNHGHELTFKIYSLAVFTIYGCDITLGICLIARLVGIDRPWVRQATTPLISGVLALSFAAAAVLGFEACRTSGPVRTERKGVGDRVGPPRGWRGVRSLFPAGGDPSWSDAGSSGTGMWTGNGLWVSWTIRWRHLVGFRRDHCSRFNPGSALIDRVVKEEKPDEGPVCSSRGRSTTTKLGRSITYTSTALFTDFSASKGHNATSPIACCLIKMTFFLKTRQEERNRSSS